jgi:hypothetical protein
MRLILCAENSLGGHASCPTERMDLISFDPRGINRSEPRISCYTSEAEALLFTISSSDLALNIPVNLTEDAVRDLRAQMRRAEAAITAVAEKCLERTGDALRFVSTQSVVKDLDHISKLINGDEKM